MSNVIERLPLTEALKSFLSDKIGWETEVLRGPTEIVDGKRQQKSPPYIVIIPIHKGQFLGPMGDPWTIADFTYHIKTVGAAADQAQWASDKVRVALLSRDERGRYEHTLNMEGLTVIDRRPHEQSPGAATLEGNIFEIDDFYVISVTTS